MQKVFLKNFRFPIDGERFSGSIFYMNKALSIEQELDLIAQDARDEQFEREMAQDWEYQDFLCEKAQREQDNFEEWLRK